MNVHMKTVIVENDQGFAGSAIGQCIAQYRSLIDAADSIAAEIDRVWRPKAALRSENVVSPHWHMPIRNEIWLCHSDISASPTLRFYRELCLGSMGEQKQDSLDLLSKLHAYEADAKRQLDALLAPHREWQRTNDIAGKEKRFDDLCRQADALKWEILRARCETRDDIEAKSAFVLYLIEDQQDPELLTDEMHAAIKSFATATSH